MTVLTKRQHRLRRRRRVRARITGTAERPRLSVYRSNRGISAQLIDDRAGHTLAAVNWIEPELRELSASAQAKRAGELLAERAKAAGVESCVFDRGGYQYHGRVRALAEGAREGGLKF
ncbi:MAG TPA: 50S ribosomal protein L18 [Solirubrobacterales bacterium]|nr:50S ribosomal protein L18 [Solirubrobacterales bacterium]